MVLVFTHGWPMRMTRYRVTFAAFVTSLLETVDRWIILKHFKTIYHCIRTTNPSGACLSDPFWSRKFIAIKLCRCICIKKNKPLFKNTLDFSFCSKSKIDTQSPNCYYSIFVIVLLITVKKCCVILILRAEVRLGKHC